MNDAPTPDPFLKIYSKMSATEPPAEPAKAAPPAPGPSATSRFEQIYKRTMDVEPKADARPPAAPPAEAPKPKDSTPPGAPQAKETTRPTADRFQQIYGKTMDVQATEGTALEVKVPEGLHVDEKAMGEFKTIAREMKLDAPRAQRFMDLHARSIKAMQDAGDAAEAQWVAATKNDQEIGGESLDDSLRVARGLAKEFGTAALTKALSISGMGNHPEVIRLLARAGRALHAARSRR